MLKLLLAFVVQAASDEPPAGSAAIDKAVNAIPGYKGVGTPPIGDDAFLKRVMADLVDAAPTAAQLQAFVDDPDPKKRAKKINQLLADPRFGEFWGARFAESFLGRLKSVRFNQLGDLGPGVEESILPGFLKWFAEKLNKDAPWTEIVTELLDARGSVEQSPALAYKLAIYRTVDPAAEFAEGVARHFLALRLRCARCHDHPYDTWSQKHFYEMAAFAAGQRVEIREGKPFVSYDDVRVLKAWGAVFSPRFLGDLKPAADEDRMKALAPFITVQHKSQLSAAFANRVWSWLFGRGVVHPADDFNPMSRPLSGELIGLLAREAREGGFSLKRLVRTLCNSQNYQMPTPVEAPEGESFRHLAARKDAMGGFIEKTTKFSPGLEFVTPESWKRVGTMGGAKALFRIPDPRDPFRHAELRYYEGPTVKEDVKVNVAQFTKPAVREERYEGKMKGKLQKTSGTYSCWKGSTASLEVAVLVAVPDPVDGRSFAFRLEGPSDLVEEVLGVFHSMIQGAHPR